MIVIYKNYQMVYYLIMKILITNDDGVFSPGLAAAVNAVSGLGDVTVAAPEKQQTAAGRSITGNRDQKFSETVIKAGGNDVKAYYIDCSPALVLKFAFTTIFREEKPDLLISGINYGENIGTDITVSGTLGAAFEAASIGIPSIAVSLQTPFEYHLKYGEVDWSGAEYFLKKFTRKFADSGKGFRDFSILKIDVPDTADSDTPWVRTSLTNKPYYINLIRNGNKDSFLNEMKLELNNPEDHAEGTDAYALLKERKVSVTPVKTDLTAEVSSLFI